MVGISYGMGVLIVNLVYLFISLIIGIIVGRVFKRWKVGIVTFLIVIILPFYDLIIQKGINTYYENFVTLEEIYSYPERDENGKIESLSIEKFIGTQSIESLKNVQKLEYIKRYYHTLDFLDIYVYGSLEKIVDENGTVLYEEKFRPNLGYIKLYLNKPNIQYEKISGIEEFSARYQIYSKTTEYPFHIERLVEFWDKKKNVLLAKGIEINFPQKDKDDNKFRNKYLLLKSGNGIGLSIQRIRSHHLVFEKLYGFKIHTSKI